MALPTSFPFPALSLSIVVKVVGFRSMLMCRRRWVVKNSFFPLFSKYIYNLISDEQSVRESTLSVLEAFASDGVRYLELRTTPRAAGKLERDGYIGVVLSAIKSFESSDSHLKTSLILSVDRRDSPSQALETADLAIRLKDEGEAVVGMDLCGDPRKEPEGGVKAFEPAFHKAKEAGLKLTVHFAEAKESSSPNELEEILSWDPDRLGHVICVPSSIKERIKERKGLGLELCLSCNVKAGMIEGGVHDHHFGEWYSMGEERPRITIAVSTLFSSPCSTFALCESRPWSKSEETLINLLKRRTM
jgi:adenosine deaminase